MIKKSETNINNLDTIVKTKFIKYIQMLGLNIDTLRYKNKK